MNRFGYFVPQSLEEASRLLREYGSQVRLLAGGTDLMIQIRKGVLKPKYLIDCGKIEQLNGIRLDGKCIKIGAATKLAQIGKSTLIKEKIPVLSQAVGVLASMQVRNLATLGGNLCNAAPSADTAPGLIALGAKAVIYSQRSERSVELEDFFQGPGKTVLAADEILIGIDIPLPEADSECVYLKHTLRRSMDIALVGVAVMLSLKDGRCKQSRVVLGAVAPTPVRAVNAEAILNESVLTEEGIQAASQAAASECRPISDIRCSAEHRRRMVSELTTNCIKLLKNGGLEDERDNKAVCER